MSHLSAGSMVERPGTAKRPAARAFVHLAQRDALGGATRVTLEYLPSGCRRTMTLKRAMRLFPPPTQ